VTRALAAVCLLAASGHAVETHGAAERVAWIERALAALRATPPEALAEATRYAQVMSRSSCASETERLAIECLMTAMRQYCRKKGDSCTLVFDVILARLLGDAQRIPVEKRYQIMTRKRDYHRELERESRQLAGALAVDFRLRTGPARSDAQLARNLDQYCLTASDDNEMPWQACVSSLVWFIAGGENR
jgi:hypothetical protein